MQLDDLKSTWQEELNVKDTLSDFTDLCREVDTFYRRSNVAWMIELFTCAAVIVACLLILFVWPVYEQPSLLFYFGTGSMILCSLFIAGKISLSRKTIYASDGTLAEKLNQQIEKREKEAKLLRSVAYWYLSPIFVAIILTSYGGYTQRTGSYTPSTGLWIYWGLCVVLCITIYGFNQHQLKTKVNPILEKLYNLKSQLED